MQNTFSWHSENVAICVSMIENGQCNLFIHCVRMHLSIWFEWAYCRFNFCFFVVFVVAIPREWLTVFVCVMCTLHTNYNQPTIRNILEKFLKRKKIIMKWNEFPYSCNHILCHAKLSVYHLTDAMEFTRVSAIFFANSMRLVTTNGCAIRFCHYTASRCIAAHCTLHMNASLVLFVYHSHRPRDF